MRTRVVSAVGLISLLISGACTSSGSDDAGAQVAGGAGSLALLSVERFVDPDGTTVRMVAGAKIARFRGIDGDALLSLLGAESLELEHCVLSSGLKNPALSAQAEVELLSVGDLMLRTGGSDTLLEPRLFPALAATASGFFYAVDTETVPPRAELDELVLRAPGENGLGAFELAMATPGDLVEVQLGGSRLQADASIDRTIDLVIAWEAEDPRDRIEIELLAGGNVLTCAGRDDGLLVIDRALLSQLDAVDDGAIVVRRVRGAAFDMAGVEAAYARVSSTRSASLLIR